MKKLFLSSSFSSVAALLPILAKEDVEGKKVTFIPTASIKESVNFYVDEAKKAFRELGLIIDELEISQANIEEISTKIRANDYIYVSGGNTFFLLQEMKRTGTDKLILEQVTAGKLYIGESAGASITAADVEYMSGMDTLEAAQNLESFSALGLVDFYPLPHHTNYPFEEAVEQIIAKYDARLTLYPFSNSQVIWVCGANVKIESL